MYFLGYKGRIPVHIFYEWIKIEMGTEYKGKGHNT